ncbi:hypothetical protein QYE76_058610 [Lolium multiflorum]|uniref:Transposase-associated domain-containing protein n=1 Tax=Lolium multiflorum TaxID=4521 RepID=A0AAD8WQ56_LOLMU|nr:hypothetical protein QYE76_058610 [Lolium multiflorum]
MKGRANRSTSARVNIGLPDNGWLTQGCGTDDDKVLMDIAFCKGEAYRWIAWKRILCITEESKVCIAEKIKLSIAGKNELYESHITMKSKMNRQWMYIDRRFDEFTSGLENFIAVAEANKHGGFMYCPCVDCKNIVNYAHSSLIHSHLLRAGFMPSYYCWTKHGERGVMMEDNEEEEEDDDGYPNFPEYGDTAEGNEDNEVEDQRHQMSPR